MAESELFVVRIWRQIADGFRATVRRVDGDETRQFSRPEDVTRFLVDTANNGGSQQPGELR
jgi:nucleoside-diphosphate-sugar epimerase